MRVNNNPDVDVIIGWLYCSNQFLKIYDVVVVVAVVVIFYFVVVYDVVVVVVVDTDIRFSKHA